MALVAAPQNKACQFDTGIMRAWSDPPSPLSFSIMSRNPCCVEWKSEDGYIQMLRIKMITTSGADTSYLPEGILLLVPKDHTAKY